MAGNKTPWWQRAVQFVLKGIRAVFGADAMGTAVADEPLAREPETVDPEVSKPEMSAPETNAGQQTQVEEIALTEDSPKASSNPTHDAEPPAKQPDTAENVASTLHTDSAAPENAATLGTAETVASPAVEFDDPPELPADLIAEAALGSEAVAEVASEPANEPELEEAAEIIEQPEESELAADADIASTLPASAEPESPEMESVESAFDPMPAEERIEPVNEAAVEEPEAIEEADVDEFEPESKTVAAIESIDEPSADLEPLPGQAIEETVVTPEIETEATAKEPELDDAPEEVTEEESAEDLSAQESAAEAQADQVRDQITEEPPAEEQTAEELSGESVVAETATAPAEAEPAATAAAEPTESGEPQLPPKAASAPPQVAHEPIKREDGPENSPFSVVVSQVYEGPFDLLLDLIRKQDIDIYDIPIAKITAQFLAYVNKLKASDMDVAGEFIYTASLLIHIKSKMLLPREPSGPDDAQEDPRRELVERLLEHERFKNAAQMLQQKQMLEAATWTNPGFREFREDAGAEAEIAADTTDLVRVFREILDRARNRPMLNLQEDSVTVGQMIQFLGRRLTMEDKPIALRRLLAHTKSERALIAMFLALLELVRLQAILLRQDRHFSEILIKKNTGFDAVMNEGMARDDWQ